MSATIWDYPAKAGYTAGVSLAGFEVEATDGSVGKVEEHFEDDGAAYLVVNTGTWLFGKKCLLPAGVIRRLDTTDQKIHVELTQDQVKGAPEFDGDAHLRDAAFHEVTGTYYDRQLRCTRGETEI